MLKPIGFVHVSQLWHLHICVVLLCNAFWHQIPCDPVAVIHQLIDENVSRRVSLLRHSPQSGSSCFIVKFELRVSLSTTMTSSSLSLFEMSEYTMSFLNKLRIKDYTPTVTQLLCIKLLSLNRKRFIYVLFCISRLATHRQLDMAHHLLQFEWKIVEVKSITPTPNKVSYYNFILVWWEFTGFFIKYRNLFIEGTFNY